MASERISIICSNYSLAERRALTQYPGQQRLDMCSIGLELQVLHQILDRSSFLMVRHNRDVPAILIDQSQQYLADIRIHPPSPLYISDTVYPFPGRGKPSFALSPNSSLLQIPYKISSLIWHLSSVIYHLYKTSPAKPYFSESPPHSRLAIYTHSEYKEDFRHKFPR